MHSSFQPVQEWDLVLPIDIENQTCYVYVLKRPGVDIFLEKLSHHYEITIYTASLSKYANPLMDWLDPKGLWKFRLFREHCTNHNGVFVKDLSRLNRPLKHTIIIDNSPPAYMFHRECAIPCTSWYDDLTWTELYQLIPILECLAKVNDVRPYISSFVKEDRVLFSKASQVLRGGKLGERAQSMQRFEPNNIDQKDIDCSKKRKDKRGNYKKRNASERRYHKTSNNTYKSTNFNAESYSSSLKYQSKYSSHYRGDSKESQTVKHNTTKLEKQTPKQNTKYYSRFDNSVEK